jgi:hypothetical protein
VINNSKSFIEEVEKDNQKLSLGLKYQDFEAYNLVFCNLDYHYMNELKDAVLDSNPSIHCQLTISYFKDDKKVTPKLITNRV